MSYYSFRWLADRIGRYGWFLQNVSGSYWFYAGKDLPQTLVEVEERLVAGRPILIVRKVYVDVFDECIQENFGESLYDGSEEALDFEPE